MGIGQVEWALDQAIGPTFGSKFGWWLAHVLICLCTLKRAYADQSQQYLGTQNILFGRPLTERNKPRTLSLTVT
jgi:Na+-transporting NADH:ubiquinone oxidoreductase subunit NqrE